MKKAIALFISLVVALGLFEIFLRIAGPLHGETIQGSRILLPTNRVYVYDNLDIPGVDRHIVDTKNSIGFRGPNPPPDFDHWLSIVAVGGSATECFYLSDGNDWPARLAAKLEPSFNHLWVNNAGLDGHSSFGSLLLVQDYLPHLKPKLVLILTGANDIGLKDANKDDDKIVRGTRAGSMLRMAAREIQNRSRVVGFIQFAYRTLAAKHHATMHRGLDFAHATAREIPDSQFKAIRLRHEHEFLPAFENRLQALVALCRKNGMEPVLITHPALYGDKMDEVTGINLGTIEVDEETNGKMAWKRLQLYNDRIRDIARKENVFLIDLANEMPKSSRYFCDFYHMTNSGADRVAEIVARHLGPYLKTHYSSFTKI